METETKHSRFSPSSATRWTTCTASVTLADRLRKKGLMLDVPSLAASEGTKAHEVVEAYLYWDNYRGYKTSILDDCDPEMLEAAEVMVKEVRERMGPRVTLHIERPVQMTSVSKDIFGTADVILWDWGKRKLTVMDFKYGTGTLVEVEHNLQLMAYAVMFADYLADKEQWPLELELVIVQPRIPNIQSQILEDATDWLDYYRLFFRTKFSEAQIDQLKVFRPSSKNCRWCQCAAVCPAVRSLVADDEFLNFEDRYPFIYGVDKDKEPVDLNEDELQTVSKILEAVPTIEAVIKRVREFVTARLAAGDNIDGWKLIRTRSIRKFSEKGKELLPTLLGEDAYKKTLIGVVAAEKLLGKDGIEPLVEKSEGSLTIVPESDPRPDAIHMNLDGFDVVNDK